MPASTGCRGTFSLDQPRRSFCPACGKTIPWYENLPIISWLALRGTLLGLPCEDFPAYILVEILTAGLFLAAWLSFGLPRTGLLAVLALLVTATFIDIEHFIIPDVITIGGTAGGHRPERHPAGLMQTDSRLHAFLARWGGGARVRHPLAHRRGRKARLCRKRMSSRKAAFLVEARRRYRTLTVGEDSLLWHEIDFRERDQLVIESTGASIDGGVLRARRSCAFATTSCSMGAGEAAGPDRRDQRQSYRHHHSRARRWGLAT